MAAKSVCKIDGCDKPAKAHGWCGAHYKKWRIYGDPKAGAERSQPYGVRRRWLNSHLGLDSPECLLYPFSQNPNGYSIITLPGGRMMSAHRYMCTATNGAPPSTEHEVAHSCGNRQCVNPRHLRWATKSENAADRLTHGTDPRGSKNGNAKLSEADVREIVSLRGIETGRSLAKRFGVTAAQISNIQLRRQWRY